MKKYLLAIYSVLRLSTLRYVFGKGVKFHILQSHSPSLTILIQKGATLSFGKNTQFESNCDIHLNKDAKIKIGARSYFNKRCMLSAHQEIEVGENCLFGPDVKIYDNDHCFESGKGVVSGKHKSAPISIGNNCWIAANVVILRGLSIGDNCIVGAGVVVKSDLRANTITTLDQSISTKNLA